jgi:hydroxymethylpyrimidine pyrophosphatase-like HAD family hydrolase
MIQFSGVGIAMANAPQRVREAADLVAGDNNEDGLALLLKDYFGV